MGFEASLWTERILHVRSDCEKYRNLDNIFLILKTQKLKVANFMIATLGMKTKAPDSSYGYG
ncbi:hypothetical protein H5410_053776 [Solanum commersonii]|uniref:Uncharacterized protein n=1 Tax=Solanum commersonii TaxID=4109 RepID=A0A9J5X6T0_SOLCO|nr:hypothetical protein H5410_053776 [Solanum commersonii]